MCACACMFVCVCVRMCVCHVCLYIQLSLMVTSSSHQSHDNPLGGWLYTVYSVWRYEELKNCVLSRLSSITLVYINILPCVQASNHTSVQLCQLAGFNMA